MKRTESIKYTDALRAELEAQQNLWHEQMLTILKAPDAHEAVLALSDLQYDAFSALLAELKEIRHSIDRLVDAQRP